MDDKKHYVYSARTTPEGLQLLFDKKGDRPWDEFVNEAMAGHYKLDLATMTLPKSEHKAEQEQKQLEKAEDKAKKAKAREDAKKEKAKLEKAKQAKKAKDAKDKATKDAKDKAAKDKAAKKAKADKDAHAAAASEAATDQKPETTPKPAEEIMVDPPAAEREKGPLGEHMEAGAAIHEALDKAAEPTQDA